MGINKEAHKHSAWMKTINNKENVSKKRSVSIFLNTRGKHTSAILKKKE